MKLALLIILALVSISTVLSQKQIETKTVWEYSYKGNKEIKQKESVSKFDTKSNLIEFTEYTNDGSFKKHQTYKYDRDNNKIEETHLDENGKIVKVIKYQYKDNIKIKKAEFDSKNKLKSQKVYEYTFF